MAGRPHGPLLVALNVLEASRPEVSPRERAGWPHIDARRSDVFSAQPGRVPLQRLTAGSAEVPWRSDVSGRHVDGQSGCLGGIG